MVLIIGGAYQGKHIFAKEMFCPEKEVSGAVGTMEDFINAHLIFDFHKFIRRQLEKNKSLFDIINQLKELILQNPDIIIDIDEVGNGIVPMEAEERSYREAVGRISTWLAKNAKEVYRVMAGIGVKIK